MLSAKALVYNNEKTKKLFNIASDERPVSAQIFGGDAESMGEAAKILESLGADIVDINLGCPAKKISKSGAGAKLLADEKLICDILEKTVKSVNIPVTIKIRIGLFPRQNVAPEIVKIAQNCGVKMAAVHARAASDGHSGEPDLQAFEEACAFAKIPIIANGGIVDEKTASAFLKIPNCSGLMIGRGALGNYSIFDGLNKFFSDNLLYRRPSKLKKKEWFKRHALMSADYYGEKKGLTTMRKLTPYYFKDFPNASKIRASFNKILAMTELEELLSEI
jgi:tRNA-dihydrouridine synthase B